jgi:hypothetical protein
MQGRIKKRTNHLLSSMPSRLSIRQDILNKDVYVLPLITLVLV